MDYQRLDPKYRIDITNRLLCGRDFADEPTLCVSQGERVVGSSGRLRMREDVGDPQDRRFKLVGRVYPLGTFFRIMTCHRLALTAQTNDPWRLFFEVDRRSMHR